VAKGANVNQPTQLSEWRKRVNERNENNKKWRPLKSQQRTPLHVLIRAEYENGSFYNNCFRSIITSLVNGNVNLNATDISYNTPLHLAVKREEFAVEIGTLLLKYDYVQPIININAVETNYRTPLHFAVQHKTHATELATLLRAHGANIDTVDPKLKDLTHQNGQLRRHAIPNNKPPVPYTKSSLSPVLINIMNGHE
jgi:ankyrin repeat protein